MRPRPEGRGEPPVHPRRRLCRNASMRPRPEGRGERRSCNSTSSRLDMGFNAATTRRPWRTTMRRADISVAARELQCGHDPKAVENEADAASHSTGSRRFNAATTRRPWRTRAHGMTSGRSVTSFNAATTRRPWRTGRGAAPILLSRSLASMRPRPEGRGERDDARRSRDGDLKASMRPRPEGRGERQAPHGILRDVAHASMRPRPEGRGER